MIVDAERQLTPVAEIRPENHPQSTHSERAAANIRSWQSYLPEDCVQRMIQDGWHWST